MLAGKIFEGLSTHSNLSKSKELSKEGLRQYVIFHNETENLYAIHVSKVEGLIILKDLEIAKNTKSHSIIVGKTNIRGNMVTLVDFEMWLNGKKYDEELNELVMLCSYGGEQFGLIIRSVYGVRDFEAKNIAPASSDDIKISFITEFLEGEKKRMCNILDSDRLLFDSFPSLEREAQESSAQNSTLFGKKILFTQTSVSMQQIVRNYLTKAQIDFKQMYDGHSLIEYVKGNYEDLDAIVLDLDVPKKDGIEIVESLKNDKKTETIPLIIFGNMAIGVLENRIKELGVSEVIPKADVMLLGKTLSIIVGAKSVL